MIFPITVLQLSFNCFVVVHLNSFVGSVSFLFAEVPFSCLQPMFTTSHFIELFLGPPFCEPIDKAVVKSCSATLHFLRLGSKVRGQINVSVGTFPS